MHGNSVAVLNPKGKPRVMFAGHIDEIGLQITHIDEDGFLYFSGIGGWDSQVLVGQRVLILSREGPVHGVVGKKAIHQLKKEELDRVTKVIDLWLDIGAANHGEAAARVRIGDPGVLDSRVEEYPNGRIVSTKGRARPEQVYDATGGAIPTKIPVAVLVNRQSASASSPLPRPARKSRGPEAALAPARSASSPMSPSWSTSRTRPTIPARTKSTRATTSWGVVWS